MLKPRSSTREGFLGIKPPLVPRGKVLNCALASAPNYKTLMATRLLLVRNLKNSNRKFQKNVIKKVSEGLDFLLNFFLSQFIQNLLKILKFRHFLHLKSHKKLSSVWISNLKIFSTDKIYSKIFSMYQNFSFFPFHTRL